MLALPGRHARAAVHSRRMDPFVLIILGIVAGLVLWILFLGVYHPRSASEVLDWRPTRSVELEVQNELDDIEQLLEATNSRRRAGSAPRRWWRRSGGRRPARAAPPTRAPRPSRRASATPSARWWTPACGASSTRRRGGPARRW